jgi:hypothetical protein
MKKIVGFIGLAFLPALEDPPPQNDDRLLLA